MSEREPNPERLKIFTDDELIHMSIDTALEQQTVIEHATARMIASQLHGGQDSALYSLSSTGAIDFTRAMSEISDTFPTVDEQTRRTAAFLVEYLMSREDDFGPVEGWSKLWLRGDI